MNRLRALDDRTTGPPSGDRVKLSLPDWLKLISLVVTLIGAGWKFTTTISTEIAVLQVEVHALADRVATLERPRAASAPHPAD